METTLFYLIAGAVLLFSFLVRWHLMSTYQHWSQIRSASGKPGGLVARIILDANNLQAVPVEPVHGPLTDHYDPRRDRLRLAKDNFVGNSVAATAVAAHECGHALQDADNYRPTEIRSVLAPIANAGARRFDSRLWMHYNAVVVTPAMALTRPGAGSDYYFGGLDSKSRPLDGGKSYRLHLPPNFPVKDNWSVTIYDTQTRSMLQTDQKYAGINSLGRDMKMNADGSIDVYFAPTAPEGREDNWIQSIPGKSWFIILRAYGPLEPWLDQTWRPSELELVE